MGFFDWLKSLFGNQGYAAKQALHYVKKNYDKYKVIKPSNRPEFEQMFLSLANNEISRLNRLLTEEEINPLAQRVRIRQFQRKEKITGTNTAQQNISATQKYTKGWSENIKQHKKVLEEILLPALISLTKSITKIEYLEAKYWDALEKKDERVFSNNKRDFSDIEEELRVYINQLENVKNELIQLYPQRTFQTKLQEMITLWKETLKSLQQARIINNNEQKATILSTINRTLRQKHIENVRAITQELNSQRERIEDFYTEMPQEYLQEQEAKAAK